MTATTQWLRIQFFPNICSNIYVSHEARGCLCVAALCGMTHTGTPWRRWPAAYGKGNAVYRHYADGRGRSVWPCWMDHRQVNPDLSAVSWESTVVRAHASAAGAPRKREGVHPRPQLGQLSRPDPHLGGSTGPSSAPAREGRPAPRQHLGLDSGSRLDGRAVVWPERGPGLGSTPCAPSGWGRHSRLGPVSEPLAHDLNGTRRATPWNGPWLAQTRASRGHPL